MTLSFRPRHEWRNLVQAANEFSFKSELKIATARCLNEMPPLVPRST